MELTLFRSRPKPVVPETLVTAADVKSHTFRVTLYDDEMRVVELTILRNVVVDGFVVRGADEMGLQRVFYVPYFKVEELP